MSDVFRISGSYDLQDRVTDKLKNVQDRVKKGKEEVDKAEKGWSKFSEKLGKVGTNIQGFGKKFTLGVTTPVLGFLGLTAKMANDLFETERKTDLIFKNMSSDVKDWANSSEQALGLGSGTIMGFANTVADVYMGLGASSEQAYGVTKDVVTNSVKLANWAGVKTEEAIEDVKSAMLGQTRAVEKYGIKLNESVFQQEMMNMGLKGTFKDLTEVEKAQVRYQAILSSSGNAIEYWDEGNRSMAFNIQYLKEQIGNLCENIGQVLVPVFKDIVDKTKPVVEGIVNWTKQNPELTGTIVKITIAISLLMPIIWGLGIAIGALTSPITLVILAIGAFVAGIMCLWNTNEGFRNKVLEIWGYIKDFINDVCVKLQAFWDEWGDEITALWNELWRRLKFIFQHAIDLIMNIVKFFVAFFTGNWEGAAEAVKGIVESLVLGLLSMFGLCFDNLEDAARYFANIFTGIWNGIVSVVKTVVNTIITGINVAIRGINRLGSIDLPDFVNDKLGIPDFKLNIPTIPKWYSEGAIFTQRTILSNNIGVGDADNGKGDNPEAVLPIDKLRDMIKDLLQIELKMNVDGREFVREVVAPHQEEMNSYNRIRNIARAY